MKNILDNPAHKPQKVFIITNHIATHLSDEESAQAEENPDLSITNLKTEQVKQALLDNGIAAENIEVHSQITKEMNGPDNWVIFNRHAKNDQTPAFIIPNSTQLQLPFSNFVHDARELGLIQLDEPQFKKALEVEVEAAVAKMEEKKNEPLPPWKRR